MLPLPPSTEVCSVFISYDLWIYKRTKEIFSMTAHYICDNVRGHGHIRMFTKISTDGESLAVPFDKVFNQFNLGSKLVGITSDDGPNLAR